MSPSSGARSGTKPSRTSRGQGNGQIRTSIALTCGHSLAHRTPLVTRATVHGPEHGYICPDGCGLQWARG